jgi:uncharacterized protein with PQ loop repeat
MIKTITTIIITLFILCCIWLIYSIITAPTDVELWGEEIED